MNRIQIPESYKFERKEKMARILRRNIINGNESQDLKGKALLIIQKVLKSVANAGYKPRYHIAGDLNKKSS